MTIVCSLSIWPLCLNPNGLFFIFKFWIKGLPAFFNGFLETILHITCVVASVYGTGLIPNARFSNLGCVTALLSTIAPVPYQAISQLIRYNWLHENS